VRALVTGVAGFLGSHLAEALLQTGWQVRGVDACSDDGGGGKRANVAVLLAWPAFTLAAVDLRSAELAPLLDGVDTVFHLAADTGAEAGPARPAPARFGDLVQHDLCVTQRLLDAATPVALTRFVLASSAAVYGSAPAYPTTEADLPRPRGAEGVTKLAAEHLCALYADAGVPTVALRYFTVYGPRQRPDMLLHRLCRAALDGEPVEVRGDGSQARSLVYVGDAVAATLAAAGAPVPPGTVVNVGGVGASTVAELLDVLADLVGRAPAVRRLPALPGDVALTYAGNGRAAQLLGWAPRVALRTGLRAQLDWHRGARPAARAALV